MTVFADSSALVTLYADEPGRNHLFGEEPIVVSHLARVEVPAALWRKHRIGELGPDQARVLTEEFESDFFGTAEQAPRFIPVAMTVAILDAAARLCATHGLRAYDGVQLAASLGARAADRDCTDFAAYDDALRRAAAIEGFRLLPEAAN